VVVGTDVPPDGDFVLLLHEADELEPEALETLLRAIHSSGADVVTCGIHSRMGHGEDIHLFLGDARELGVIANHFGLVGLYRRDVLREAERKHSFDTRGDVDWLRLASLSLDGAKIVSVPAPLVRTTRSPGAAATDPIGSGMTLAVVQEYERASTPGLEGLPRLAAALAARRIGGVAKPPLAERLRWIWEHEGMFGLARRIGRKTDRMTYKARSYPGRVSDRIRNRNRRVPGGEAAPKAG
jgi:hypothetical protein